jgi:nucleotide-binding universal stress UspA family protein
MDHIVIGVDGSPAATAAGRWAAREAVMRNVELTVHVQSAPEISAADGVAGDPTTCQGRRRPTRASGENPPRHPVSHRQDHRSAATPQYQHRVCIGAVVPTLSGFSHKESHMIVVGRRGRGGIHRALLGSVSTAVVQACRIPSLSPDGPALTPSALAHVAPEMCPMTSNAGFSPVVGVAESRRGSTELAQPPHFC